MSSPGYKLKNYTDNLNCDWTVIAPAGMKVSLSMVFLETEFGYDIVRIFNGAAIKKNLLMTMSGSSTDQNIVKNEDILISSQETMTVTFKSDTTNNMKGFTATVQAIYKTGKNVLYIIATSL